jgi:hypothetical protein
MQTESFLNTRLTTSNTKGRTFSTTVFELEELGWYFGYHTEWGFCATDIQDDDQVIIEVDEDGRTSAIVHDVGAASGDDQQTIKDLETLRAAHQLEEL